MADEIPFANLDAYLEQWRRNRRCCMLLDRQFVDWQITVLFYTALHAINAAAAFLGKNVCDHMQRNDLVKSNEAFAPVRVQYLRLYRLSRFTRYDPRPDEWIPERYMTVQAIADDLLIPIERQVESLIKRDLKLPALKVKD